MMFPVKSLKSVLIFFLIALTLSRVSGVVIFHVTTGAKHDNNKDKPNGKAWKDSVNITEAFSEAAALEGDDSEIWLQRGSYDAPIGGFFAPVSGNISVYGGFKGTEDAKEDRRVNKNAKQTVISGLLNSVDHIFTVSSNANLRVSISEVKFEHATLNAVYINNDMDSNVSVAISSVVFESNGNGHDSNSGGGALYVKYADVTLIESVFESNRGYLGGAFYAENSDLVHIETCSYINNTAIYGGGIYLIDVNEAVISQSEFESNSAVESGGSIYSNCTDLNIYSLDTTISGGRFELNEAGYDGGAIYVYGSTNVVISDTSMVNNSAIYLGGAVLLFGTDNSIISDSEFIDNNATEFGGGISAQLARQVSIEQSNFSSNFGGWYGGAIDANLESTVWIEGSVFANNAAVDGGFALNAEEFSQISVASSVFIEDTTPESVNDLFSTYYNGTIEFGLQCLFDFGGAARTECYLLP